MQTALSTAVSASIKTHRRATSPSSIDRSTPPEQNVPPTLRVRFDPAHRQTATLPPEEAIPGNHLAIQTLLQRELHGPTPAQFNAEIQQPGYQAEHRLVVKRAVDRRLVGHVHAPLQMHSLDGSELPVGRVRQLAASAEYRRRGLGDQMLRAAEEHAGQAGAMVLLARGDDHQLLSRNGWVPVGADSVLTVSPQRLMGQLPKRPPIESPFYEDQRPQEIVRLGRLTDLDTLSELYDTQLQQAHGMQHREREYWSWLLTKSSHDRMYIFSEDETALGYIVVRGASVIELIDNTDDHRAAARLLEYVAADAIEQGRHALRIHASRTHRVHQWAAAAGAQSLPALPADTWLAKVPSYRTLLRRLASSLHRRVGKGADVELSLRIGNEELLIRNGVRSMKITRGRAAQHRIGITSRAAAQLLLGYRSVADLAADKKLVASSETALKLANQLFPQLDLWRNQWDELA